MWINNIKTVVLLSSLSALFLAFGVILGGSQGLQIALLLALLINGITYFFSDKIVLRLYNAQALSPETHAYIFSCVHELAQRMNMPMPKLWLVHTPMANAFASGRNPANASIALTSGILRILSQDELRGVLAHEMAHIKNRDILISTVAATLATAIGYIANMLHHIAFWASVTGNSKREKGMNPFAAILVAILMPIAATLIQLAISRSREFEADATGAECTHEPLALASALQKLHGNIAHDHLEADDRQKAATAPLFIVHPFTSSNFVSLFSTHPPLARRIERLQKMSYKVF